MKLFILAIALLLSSGVSASAETIRVGTKHAPPVMYTSKSAPSGFSIDVWEATARDLDLQTQYHIYPTVAELMDGIRNNEIDVAIGAISVTADREARGIDFSFPYYQSGLQIIQSKNNEAIHVKLSRHLGGWQSLQAVGLVLGSCLFCGTLIYWFERNDSEFQVQEGSKLQRFFQGVGKGFWFSVVTLGTFGYGDLTPKTFKGRAIAVIWMGVSFFVLANYISAVTERRLSQSKEEISLRNERTTIGVVERTSADAFLKRHPVQTKAFGSIEAAIQELKDGDIDGVLTDAPIARYSVKRDSRLLANDTLVSEEMYAMALKEGNDTLKERLDQFLIRNIETIKAMEEKWTIQELD